MSYICFLSILWTLVSNTDVIYYNRCLYYIEWIHQQCQTLSCQIRAGDQASWSLADLIWQKSFSKNLLVGSCIAIHWSWDFILKHQSGSKKNYIIFSPVRYVYCEEQNNPAWKSGIFRLWDDAFIIHMRIFAWWDQCAYKLYGYCSSGYYQLIVQEVLCLPHW